MVGQCVTLRELNSSNAPALVVAETILEVNKHTTLADAIVGFADDAVKTIHYRTANGVWQTVPVKNNVFVGLVHEKLGGPQPAVHPSEIEQVRAVTASRKTIAIPFVAGYVSYPAGPPKVPSYVRTRVPGLNELPGPTHATVPYPGGTISWLVHHQPRGAAWRPQTGRILKPSAILYSRRCSPIPAARSGSESSSSGSRHGRSLRTEEILGDALPDRDLSARPEERGLGVQAGRKHAGTLAARAALLFVLPPGRPAGDHPRRLCRGPGREHEALPRQRPRDPGRSHRQRLQCRCPDDPVPRQTRRLQRPRPGNRAPSGRWPGAPSRLPDAGDLAGLEAPANPPVPAR